MNNNLTDLQKKITEAVIAMYVDTLEVRDFGSDIRDCLEIINSFDQFALKTLIQTIHPNQSLGLPTTGATSEEQAMPAVKNTAINSSPELLLKFNKVKELNAKGYTIRAISRSLGITRITIRKYLRMDFLPKKTGSRSTNFDAYQGYLLQETNA